MGILANTKQFLAAKAISAAKRTGDGIATLSALSPKQLQEVEQKRAVYLNDKPDMNGEEAQKVIQKNMGAIGIEVYQAYLDQLATIYSPVDVALENFDEDNRIRFFDITKWVTDAEEQSLDKLVNVYHVLSEEECNIALIYHRTKNQCQVTIGVVNTDERQSDPAIVDKYYSRMVGAIKGNFPGAEIQGLNSKNRDYGVGVPQALKGIDGAKNSERVKSIAIVSNIPSEKSEDFISQSMEKLLDGIVPEGPEQDYTMVLLAKPIKNQLESKNRLYELYSALAPYTSWQTGYTYTESDGVSSSANFGVNLGVSAGTHSTVSTSSGTSIAKAVTKGSSDTTGGHVGVKAAGGDYHHTWNRSKTNTVGSNESSGVSAGYNASANFGVSFSRSSSITANVGKNESITQTYVNYGVKHTLEIIESQIKRIEESSALGMWEFSSYIISDSPVIANNVAHMYLALTQGEKSYLTKSAVNFWDGDINTDAARTILSSVRKLQHPVFGLKTSLEDEWLMYPTLVTPTTTLSGVELAKALNFPRKSVSGIPVLDVVAFGREPHSLLDDNTLDLDFGCGYHMRKKIPEQRISLSKEELSKHTFITGSTGSGKSNTIYRLLERLGEENVNFLVIEPAKGEYRQVIGKKKGVVTFGTNPNMNDIQMLRINPFSFPKSVHILEHLDRLVEIFNVCWPMYAAMPAILKDSVERAYVAAGWNLEKSVNKYDEKLFPSFIDVVKQIKIVLEESDYSADNKGDYTGSLVTRLRSLTNGINGLLFTNDEVTDEELFDQNVIVDLSRVGASETKALIMGLLVLKLQEHRMDQREKGNIANANDVLKHITVLEEAHNLLKRTSTEQSSEGSNMLGKSVEMLANSIAEMRTYGEGFVIADQSPGLLDMSVIRNTNTKIILRLPDLSDRELVGKASGLTDNQIVELAKLEKGVAAISQSDWLEPVLCKIDKYTGDNDFFSKSIISKQSNSINADIVEKSLLDCIMRKEIYRKGDRVDIQRLKEAVLKSKLDANVKCEFIEYITAGKDTAVESLRSLVYDFFNAEQAMNKSKECRNIVDWVHSVAENLKPSVTTYSKKQIDLVMALLLYEQTIRDASYKEIFCRFTELFKEGGVY
ncbi:ATP-binding protein [Anaerobutyricum hallii]|uniref:ATP-binding protein n=1 Tax=Anaerobutyricum hallii TaxID=39488 RepID=UPI0026708D11|nr:ATP-binding protein [Anaerobutyricum hallii]